MRIASSEIETTRTSWWPSASFVVSSSNESMRRPSTQSSPAAASIVIVPLHGADGAFARTFVNVANGRASPSPATMSWYGLKTL